MKKELIIGLGAIAVAGAVVGGVYLSKDEIAKLGIEPSKEENYQEKIDELYFDELKNPERYVFCSSKEKIAGTYSNQIMANEKGELNYTSEGVEVLDKQDDKIYILAREITYNYTGQAVTESEIGSGLIEIKENGRLVEYYKKSDAPIRLDYNSNIIFPAPERKIKDWVYVNSVLTGTAMGLTQQTTEATKEDAKTFCSPFALSNSPLKDGSLVTPDSFYFSKNCSTSSEVPGVSFDGNFDYVCDNLDYLKAIDLLKYYRDLENLNQNKLENVSETQPVEVNSASEKREEINTERNEDDFDRIPSDQEINKLMEEAKADASAN